MVFGWIVFLIVYTHDDRLDVDAFARGRNENFFGAGGEMAAAQIRFREKSGRFDYEIDAHRFPGKERKILRGGQALNFLAVDDQNVVFLPVRSALVGAEFSLKTTVNRIVLQLISKVVGIRGNVHHCDHSGFCSPHAFFYHRADHLTPDAAKSVNCYFQH